MKALNDAALLRNFATNRSQSHHEHAHRYGRATLLRGPLPNNGPKDGELPLTCSKKPMEP
jgi:hypothetical protein